MMANVSVVGETNIERANLNLIHPLKAILFSSPLAGKGAG